MGLYRVAVVVCLAAMGAGVGRASERDAKAAVSSEPVSVTATNNTIANEHASAGFSSSATSSSNASDALPIATAGYGVSFAQAISAGGPRPFSTLAVAVKVGIGGVGFDVATPLARKFNLRAGGAFFSYTHSLVEDGVQINPDLKLRQGTASLDFYPFGGSFRISPGVMFYNGNHVSATATVPGGQTFDLNDVTYTSSATDPVHGSASIDFGNKAAPSVTIGFGNMIPRHGGHWSLPVEVGFAYIGRPALIYTLTGTACSAGNGCGSIQTDPQIQANLKAEQNELNDDIAPLRFFPIVSVGVSYKF